MSSVAIQQMADRVAELLEARMKLGGRGLGAKLGRGKRVLPKHVRDAAVLLALSAEKAKNPKLMAQIDMGAVSDSYDICVRHLMSIDPSEGRRNYVANVVSSIGFGVLAMAVVLIALLAWLGFL